MACNLIGNLTCEMQARADNTGTISTNASGRQGQKGLELFCQIQLEGPIGFLNKLGQQVEGIAGNVWCY